jgi:hypothetical protein
MKFNIAMSSDEIQVTLTESLKLPEGHSPLLESPDAQAAFGLLPQIESLVRQFLSGFVARRGETR